MSEIHRDALRFELYEAEKKAHQALSSYKFAMFGYWAGIWVHLNKIGSFNQPNPFRRYVKLAKEKIRDGYAAYLVSEPGQPEKTKVRG